MSERSISFHELRNAAKFPLPTAHFLVAADGTCLAYRSYLTHEPRAVLLFYHGGGAHSAAGYQFLGKGLQANYDTVVITPDIRGHGASGGTRGDSPTPTHVWEDISSFIRQIRQQYPGIPLFLGGHSSGAGLVLNYAVRQGREKVEGYVFLSPQLGARANTDRPSIAVPFARVNESAFAAYAASGGTAHAHDHAVQFNYPGEILASDPGLVSSITVSMSAALIPSAPSNQFASLDAPFGLWIGTEDELFLPERVLQFGSIALNPLSKSRVAVIPGEKHLSVLVRADATIGPWIVDVLR